MMENTKVKEIILTMLKATAKSYDKMVNESNGYYHNGRCPDTIKLMEILVKIYLLLGDKQESRNNGHKPSHT